MVEDERYALTQLIRLTPDDRYSERLIALGGSPEEPGEIGGLGAEAELPDTLGFEGFAITGSESDLVDEPVTPVEFEWNSVAEQPPADQRLVRRSQ